VVAVSDPPSALDGTELPNVTAHFAEFVDWNRYTGTVVLHESGWVEIPELRRMFPPRALTEIER
jgi:hypothetical protein